MASTATSLLPLPTEPSPVSDALGQPVPGWAPDAAQAADTASLLDQAWTPRQPGVLSAAVVHAVASGWDDPQLARWLAAKLADHSLAGSAVGWLVADVAQGAHQGEPQRRAVPWAVAASLVSEAAAGPIGLFAGPVSLAAACARPGPRGTALITAHKATLLAHVTGQAAPGGHDAVAATALDDMAHAKRRAVWVDRLAQWADCRDETKARAFVEPKFRVHLLQGGIDGAQRAVCRGLDVGIPHELIAQSLILAAAERLWRCDPQGDADPAVIHGRADLEAVFLLCASVRQLRGRIDTASWLDLLLFATGQVAGLAPLDLPEAQRPALPEPAALHQTWDHGPEIAKIVGHLHAGRGIQAVAVLRAYFLLALPEQPLCAQLREAMLADRRADTLAAARGMAMGLAAIDEFMAAAGHPHRELILAAATASLCAPLPQRTSLQLAEAAWQRRHIGFFRHGVLST